jgi:hypothetical protein
MITKRRYPNESPREETYVPSDALAKYPSTKMYPISCMENPCSRYSAYRYAPWVQGQLVNSKTLQLTFQGLARVPPGAAASRHRCGSALETARVE